MLSVFSGMYVDVKLLDHMVCSFFWGNMLLFSEKAVAPHSSTLAWKIPWTEEPGRLQSMGSLGVDTTEWLHFHFSLSCIGEGNGNPLQCSCLENPRDGGAWWAAVYGVRQSQTRLKWHSSSSSYCLTRWLYHFTFPSTERKGSSFSTCSPTLVLFCLFFFSYRSCEIYRRKICIYLHPLLCNFLSNKSPGSIFCSNIWSSTSSYWLFYISWIIETSFVLMSWLSFGSWMWAPLTKKTKSWLEAWDLGLPWWSSG